MRDRPYSEVIVRVGFRQQLKSFLIMLVVWSGIALAYADEPSKRLALSLDTEPLLASLRWHNSHALGALHPPSTFSFSAPLPSGINLDSFRSHVWWEGLPTARDRFVASPVLYEILSVDSVLPIENDQARVKFRGKVSALSPFYLATENIALEDAADHSRPPMTAAKNLIGKIVEFEVNFHASEYGYYLPLVRLPEE